MKVPNGCAAGNGSLRAWAPTAVYIILILVMALRPSPRLPAIRHIDKYLHAAAYAVLALFAWYAIIRSGLRRPVLLTLLLALVVGMADEGLQALGRTRSADRYDLMADLAGAAVGAIILSRVFRRKQGGACRANSRS